MKSKELIPLDEFCRSHEIEVAFVSSLRDYGLVEITTIKQVPYIPGRQLKDLEKMLRLHYEMDINLEGIEAIVNLLQRMENLHQELSTLRNRIRLYEEE